MLISNIRLLRKNVIEIPVRHYKPRRAIMYVPGNDFRKINKINNIKVDCIALDCEDGVAFNKKDEARQTIRECLSCLIPWTYKQRWTQQLDIFSTYYFEAACLWACGSRERGIEAIECASSSNNIGVRPCLIPNSDIKSDIGVRINSIESGLCEKDLEVCLSGNHLPHTVLLPKVEDSEQLHWFADYLDKYMKRSYKIQLIIYLESAKAFTNISEICKTLIKLAEKHKLLPNALVFGSDDFCASIGATRTEDAEEVLYARQKLVLYAKAYNLQAIDMVYIKYKDLEGLKRQSEQGMRMGFTGKQVIHPDQIEVVQKSFLPTVSTVEWAKGLLSAFEEHQISGKGAFTYKGSMIDMPTMKQAQNIIELMNSIN